MNAPFTICLHGWNRSDKIGNIAPSTRTLTATRKTYSRGISLASRSRTKAATAISSFCSILQVIIRLART